MLQKRLEVYRLQSVDEQKRRSRRLAENRRMAVSPEARSTQHSTWFERQSLRAEKARILRKQLSLKSEKTKTLSLEQKALKEKYREEVRKNMRDFPGLQRVQRRWLLYIAITSRLSRWVEYMMATKSLSGDIFQRIEAVNIIKRWYKLHIKLRRRRRVMAILGRVFKKCILVLYVNNRVRRKRSAAKVLITWLQERADENKFRQAVDRFRYQITIIQRWIRQYLKLHRARLHAISLQLDRFIVTCIDTIQSLRVSDVIADIIPYREAGLNALSLSWSFIC
mmetsp:Transcript_29474/g.76093  ORF Transcript_29474/g.76093 Transcript_29474/m.76093 type:complete len:280 (-) Transcript_29474:1358-2197(-)